MDFCDEKAMRYDVLQRQERTSERVRRQFLRNTLCGLIVTLLLLLGISANYGDFEAVKVLLGLLGVASSTVLLSFVFPYRVYIWIALLFSLVVAFFSHLALPFGYATTAIYIPFGLIIAAQVRKQAIAITVFVLSMAVPAVALWYGWLEPHQSSLPTWVALTVILTVSGILVALQLDVASTSLAAALQQVTADESLLERERSALAEHRTRLLAADEVYRTEIEALTRQLLHEAQLTDDLGYRQEDRQRLVHAIHQDLREPLRGIVSFTQLLRRRLPNTSGDGGVAEYLAFAEDGGRRMAKMLADLVSYTSESDGEPSTLVDLDKVLGEVQTDLADMITRTGATITVGEMPTLRGQRTQLVQLFQNLLANALKFSRPGVPPYIEVHAYTSEGIEGAHVLVSDNGVGIPANQVEKVFGLFNRAHSEHGYEGSGVGLALCRKIVIAHGGDIRVSSVPAEGTVFTIALPTAVITHQTESSPRKTLVAPLTHPRLVTV